MSKTASASIGSGMNTMARIVATAEDQKKINKFARLHKQLQVVKAELKALTNRLQDMQDASEEVELLDEKDAASIPIQLGSIFIHNDQETTLSKLGARKEQLQAHIECAKGKKAEMEGQLGELKTALYLKFGDNINLDIGGDEEAAVDE